MTDGYPRRDEALHLPPPVVGRSPISVSENRNRVAVDVTRMEGSVILDTYHYVAHLIVVYDLVRKQRALTVELAPAPKKACDLALSPDGSKLAVLDDRNVSLYSVPKP